MRHAVEPQELCRGTIMFRFDGLHWNQPTPRDVCAEAPQAQRPPGLVEHAGSDLDSKHRFHRDKRQAGHEALRARLADNAFDVFGARFFVVKLCQSTCVEERTSQSAFFPGRDHRVRKRSWNRRERPPNVPKANVIMLRCLPSVWIEVARFVVSGYRSPGNSHKNVLHVAQRHDFERREHPDCGE